MTETKSAGLARHYCQLYRASPRAPGRQLPAGESPISHASGAFAAHTQQCRSSAVRLLFVGTDACLTAEGLWTPATGKLICMYARQPRNDSEMPSLDRRKRLPSLAVNVGLNEPL
jgi:hypothetical protein